MQPRSPPLAVLLGLALLVAGCTSPEDPPAEGEDLQPTSGEDDDPPAAPPPPAGNGTAPGAEAGPQGNGTAPPPEPPAPEVRRFSTTQTLTLSSLSTPVGGGGRGDNCVFIATTAPTTVLQGTAVATWDTTVTSTLVLQASFTEAEGSERLAAEGGSPLELPLALASDVAEDNLRVFVELPEGAVAVAPGVSVEVAIAFDYTGAELSVDEATIASCS